MRRFTPGRFVAVCAALLGILVFVCLLAMEMGSARVSFLGTLFGASVDARSSELARTILLDLRLPRILLAAMVGAALGAAGTTFQAVLRNPLADPYILGVSGGAALGAIAATALGADRLGFGFALRPLAAFLGAGSTILALVLLARLRGRASNYPMLLTGVVLNALFSALILFIITVADYTRFQEVFFWLVGAIPSPTWPTIALLAVLLLAGLAALTLLGGRLNLLSLGEEEAGSLGIDVDRVKLVAILVASLVTATAVSWSGLVGFVGLMAPHAARRLWGPDHRLLVPASALGGAIFLVAADTGARSLMAPAEMPVGVVTALIGAPIFLVLFRRETRERAFD